MKVIHFVTSIDCSLGGVSTYMQLLSKELGKLVDLIVVTRPTNNPLALENCRIEYLPLPISKLGSFQKKWKDILKKEQPDVVHINGIWMLQTWIIQSEALKQGIKTYITPHGMLGPWILNRHPLKKKLALFLYQKKALKRATALIATAESEKRNIIQLGYNRNVHVIPNGIDTSSIIMKDDWTIRKKILYMSRIHIKKGIELLLDALKDIENNIEGYEVIIAGEGDSTYVEMIKERAMDIKKINITFPGGIYGEQKWELYRDCDFFILPTYSENFGYVIAESLACGTPVITTREAPWEDLERFHCGSWINRDKESLKKSIFQFISFNSDDLKKLGRNGRKLIERKYTSENVAKLLLSLYINENSYGKRTMV